ncbi:MAG: prepilin-type N-terminal cleavage/methylation protein [Actinomycetia bacterium]|nr:prepilin-type N-terminal cleavage/methylation protein [Actinomycetes bacterium]
MLTLKTLARRRGDDEKGFTLIELMVVVLIIAILIAIAIPTFLGARQRANDRAAQSSLRNALTAAKTSFTDTGDYAGATQAGLSAIEPSLTYSPGAASTGFKNVSIIAAPSGQQWWATVLSKSGKCFGILDNSGSTGTGGTSYIGGPTTWPTGTACTAPATAPTTWTDASW